MFFDVFHNCLTKVLWDILCILIRLSNFFFLVLRTLRLFYISGCRKRLIWNFGKRRILSRIFQHVVIWILTRIFLRKIAARPNYLSKLGVKISTGLDTWEQWLNLTNCLRSLFLDIPFIFNFNIILIFLSLKEGVQLLKFLGFLILFCICHSKICII